MCATLVEKLQELNDPRLGVWAGKVQIPLVVDPAKPDGYDEIVDGERIIAQDVADAYESVYGFEIDEDPEYLGLPPAWHMAPQAYNLCPTLEQAPLNPHVSHISDLYKKASDDLLRARLITAAEVNFILAEAALKGWSTGGSVNDHYEAGIIASFKSWNLGSLSDDYIEETGVVYNGTLDQIMEQKWISGWSAATESWFDYRRTGLPALNPGTVVKREALPIRFYYGTNELLYNTESAEDAIESLEATTFSSTDGKNSAWSRTWLTQGTGEPW